MTYKKRLTILSWNVFGLGKKLKDKEFTGIIEKHDMVCLMETWSSVQTNVRIKGFEHIHRIRHKRRKKGRRSGGLVLYFKKWLKPGIKELAKTHEDLLWVKLDAHFFGFERDVYFCIVYIKPNATRSPNSALLQLEKDIARFSKFGNIVLVGDFNARTGQLDDFIKDDTVDDYVHTGSDYSVDLPLYNMIRQNKDTKVNSQGKALIELCKISGLRIMNGRTVGYFW